jgi:16S rRNA (cytosine1402-N4)-methyltransferase
MSETKSHSSVYDPRQYRHVSVMPVEVLACLNLQPGQIAVDCTMGGAGHARRLLERIRPGGTFIGIDQDRDAISNALRILPGNAPDVHVIHDNFEQLPRILAGLDIPAVDAILADLGLSLNQLENSGRGFSFQRQEPLDMRMDDRSETTAAHLVNRLDADALADLFFRLGEERHSRRIARAIVAARATEPVVTSDRLARIVASAVPKSAAARSRIHPATRVFMALRIAVNRELERLETFLDAAVSSLKPGGRLCVLSFHSLEDRMVKQRLGQLVRGCICPPRLPQCACGRAPQVKWIHRGALKPTAEEVERNPMARSTRLRAVEKL